MLITTILGVLFLVSACGNTTQTTKDLDTTDSLGNLNSFVTADIEGNEVTQDIFKNYDITMVNIWGTWCKPCVEEFPALVKVYEQLPEKSNLITICNDAEKEQELCKKILQDVSTPFQTLKVSSDIQDNLLKNIYAFPTTIFVDSQGNLVGDSLMGKRNGSEEELVSYYLDSLNNALKLVRSDE